MIMEGSGSSCGIASGWMQQSQNGWAQFSPINIYIVVVAGSTI